MTATHDFCCKEAWGKNLPAEELTEQICASIKEEKSCLTSKQTASDGIDEPCCWRREGFPGGAVCAARSGLAANSSLRCAVAKVVLKASWADLPVCTEKAPIPTCRNYFARSPTLKAENCDDCEPDSNCSCIVRCAPGLVPFQGTEGRQQCVKKGSSAEFESSLACTQPCKVPDSDLGTRDVSNCQVPCAPGDASCQCVVACAEGNDPVLGGRQGPKSCILDETGLARFQDLPQCRPECLRPDDQEGTLDVGGCAACIAGTNCECNMRCRSGSKDGAKEGPKVCKLVEGTQNIPATAQWVDKKESDRKKFPQGPLQCMPPIKIQVIDAENQRGLTDVDVTVSVPYNTRSRSRLREVGTKNTRDGDPQDKSVKFFIDSPFLQVKIQKEGYNTILRDYDRAKYCQEASDCSIQIAISQKLAGNELHPDGCYITGRPGSLEWNMRAVLTWNEKPADLDIWARSYDCYRDVERRYNCSGQFMEGDTTSGFFKRGRRWVSGLISHLSADQPSSYCQRSNFSTIQTYRQERRACEVSHCDIVETNGHQETRFESGRPICPYSFDNQYTKWVYFNSRYLDKMHLHYNNESRRVENRSKNENDNGWNGDNYIVLDVDERNGNGPETVSFKNPPPGLYQIVVNQFGREAEEADITAGNPIVTIYIGSNNIAFECRVDPACQRSSRVWNVVNINVTSVGPVLNAENDEEYMYQISLLDTEETMLGLRNVDLPTRSSFTLDRYWQDYFAVFDEMQYPDEYLKNVCYGKCSLARSNDLGAEDEKSRLGLEKCVKRFR